MTIFINTREEDADHAADGEYEFGLELTLVAWQNLTR